MAFSLTGQNSPSGTKSVGTSVGTDCSTDWLSLPCATNTLSPTAQTPTAVCVDRICGMVFNSVTQATASSAVALPVNSKYYSCNSNNHNPTMPIFWAQRPYDEMTKNDRLYFQTFLVSVLLHKHNM